MARTETLSEEHDAQRTLEQRSLRNVRALLDRIEVDETRARRSRRRAAWVATFVIAALLFAFYGWVLHGPRDGGREILLVPAGARR